ncbi:MAG TPA: hypothetical protein H9948_02070 [Candidatus Jeotgalibaca merdavium]|uniref:Uncharacterized protein n=1 Tax=Candidatus Jeotgalibaca merdavium TaxID=2838627 RepID=A0A9D2I0W6_9LACT|nr:hypothetical protein [Candidatus Jeotgalibaca merdavium]
MEFMEIKRKKERGLSNEEFMDNCKEQFKDAENIVVVGMQPNGDISTYYTQQSSIAVIGMTEVAKAQLIKGIEC